MIQAPADPGEVTTSEGIALVALHAGYSHSSPALEAIQAFSVEQPYFAHMRRFEALVKTNHQELIEALVVFRPKIIGFSTYLWNIQAALRLAAVLKQLLPGCLLVFGGPEAGPRGRELLQTQAAVDYVVAGEGEAAFRDLVRWIRYREGALDQISGLHFRRQGQVVANPVQPLAVAEIPSAVAAGLASFDKPLVYWETSRGCPFRCRFCGSAGERLRAFPLSRIEEELRMLEGLRDKTIKLLDRSFHLGKGRTQQLLRRFAATPSGLRFHLELNPDRISDEAMAIFQGAEPGKFQFEIGLQTLQEQVLRTIDRRMHIPRALANIRRLVAMHRHPVHLDLIVGLPGEEALQCADSLDRTFNLYPDHLQLGTLKLLPGTPLLEQARDLGYRWDSAPPYEVLCHPLLSFQELARFKHYARLLERLWNSGYLRATLAGLVSHLYEGRLSSCLDALLREVGVGLATENLQPDSLFGRVADFVVERLQQQPALGEWLLWDYCHYGQPNRKTPEWIAQRLYQGERLSVEGTRRRLPVVRLSERAADLLYGLTGEHRPAGRYAIQLTRHNPGKPVVIHALDEVSSEKVAFK